MKRALRVLVSVGLLALVAWLLDPRALGARLAGMRVSWALLALAISIPQVAVSAYRWRLTAHRLGVELSFRTALAEYYLATFLNQVLPGAVMGDVSRAVRHGRESERMGAAAKAVVLERASGQVIMLGVAVLSLVALPIALPTLSPFAVLALGLGALVIVGAVGWVLRPRGKEGVLGGIGRDLRTALLAPDVIGAQLLASVVVVGSYIAMYCAAARAVRVETPLGTLAPLVAPVLVSMLIPATVAGWGVREATAAALWRAVGLTAVDGVAISAAYGVLVLISSLPGALVLLTSARDRRADPDRAGSDGSAGAAPARGSRSAEG